MENAYQNKRVLWIIILSLLALYIIWTTFNLTLFYIVDQNREFVKNINKPKDFIKLFYKPVLLLILFLIIFRLKPRKTTNNSD